MPGVAMHADAGILARAALQGRVQLQHTLLEKLGVQTRPTVCVISASSVVLKSEIAACPSLVKARRQLGWAAGILELLAARAESSTTLPPCPQQSQLCHRIPGTGPQLHGAGFPSAASHPPALTVLLHSSCRATVPA